MKRTFPAVAAALFFSTNLFAQHELPELDVLKINQIQVLGSHNSYALPADSILLAHAETLAANRMAQYLDKMTPEQKAHYKEFHPNTMSISESLHYEHPDFATQLNMGLRNLEIDVYYDDKGGRFSNPAGYKYLSKLGINNLSAHNKEGLNTPGFKVFHIADLDFRSHYPTLENALMALKDWSEKHPGHLPIFIQMEAKDKSLPVFDSATTVLPFTKDVYDKLDAVIVNTLGRDKIITPDNVSKGYSSLKEAVTSNNWPTVAASRGKFIFLLLPSTAGMEKGNAYISDKGNLNNRVMFAQSQPEDTFAAFLLQDNAIVRQTEIQQQVKAGYLVRTRSDIETYEAKVNDYSRAQAAFESGAQIISTDFYQDKNTYGTPYKVIMPGGAIARPNPVNAAK